MTQVKAGAAVAAAALTAAICRPSSVVRVVGAADADAVLDTHAQKDKRPEQGEVHRSRLFSLSFCRSNFIWQEAGKVPQQRVPRVYVDV